MPLSAAPRGIHESVIRTGRLAVNLAARTVDVDGRPLHLTGKEYGILELLSLRKGTTLTKEMFLNHLYGGMDEPELKIVDVFICKLRKKLAAATRRRKLYRDGLGPGICSARTGRRPRAVEGRRQRLIALHTLPAVPIGPGPAVDRQPPAPASSVGFERWSGVIEGLAGGT